MSKASCEPRLRTVTTLLLPHFEMKERNCIYKYPTKSIRSDSGQKLEGLRRLYLFSESNSKVNGKEHGQREEWDAATIAAIYHRLDWMKITDRPQGTCNSSESQVRPGQPEVPFPMHPDLTKPLVTNQALIYTSHGLWSWIPQDKQHPADKEHASPGPKPFSLLYVCVAISPSYS